MSGRWVGSNRSAELPADWPAIRQLVLTRDGHRCTWHERGQRCRALASDIDHIVRGDDHRLVNLRALCSGHHSIKSSAEGNAARWHRNPRKRQQEPHPGAATP